MGHINDKQRTIDFGVFIRNARMERKLYQAEVAEKVGITQSHLSYIENGVRVVDLVLAMRICEVLGVNINDYIRQYVENPTP